MKTVYKTVIHTVDQDGHHENDHKEIKNSIFKKPSTLVQE